MKTAHVPARDLGLWAEALADTPFGAASVRGEWPYLGVTIAGPGDGGHDGDWSDEALTAVA